MGTILFYIVLISFWLENSLYLEPQKIFGLSMGMTFNNMSIFLLILGWIFASKSQKYLYNRNKINIYLLLFGCFIILSNFVEILTYDNMSNIKQLKALKQQIIFFKNYINPWIYFILLVHIFQSKKECQNAILGIMILVFLTAATGLIDQFTTINLGTKVHGLSYEEGRSSGFGEVNQFAAFLVLLLPVVMSYTIFQKHLVPKTLYAFIFLVGFIGLIATVSRGGYIGFFIASVVFFIVSIRQKLIKMTRTLLLLILIVPIVGSFTYVALPSATKEAFRYKVIEKAGSKKYVNPWSHKKRSTIDRYTSGRIGRWADSFEVYLQSPVWGHGHYTIKKVLHISPHNDYLKILLKFGIIGFALFIMIYITIFRQICMNIKNASSNYSKMIYIGFLSGFIGYMVCMFGVGFTQPRYIFWIMTAAVIKYSQLDGFDLVES